MKTWRIVIPSIVGLILIVSALLFSVSVINDSALGPLFYEHLNNGIADDVILGYSICLYQSLFYSGLYFSAKAFFLLGLRFYRKYKSCY